jgi:DNA-binding GntR family transcriptional regulator
MAFKLSKQHDSRPIRKPRLSNQIYELIRTDLRYGRYAPDTRFTEPGIAEAMNTSRTPVREALFQLVSNGLLEEYERGYGLPKLSKSDIEQMMDIRIQLESILIEKACECITDDSLKKLKSSVDREQKSVNKKDLTEFIAANSDFRKLMCACVGNPYLEEIINLYSDRLQIYRVLTLSSKENRKTVADANKQLVEAIGKRNIRAAVRLHTRMLQQAKIAYMEQA